MQISSWKKDAEIFEAIDCQNFAPDDALLDFQVSENVSILNHLNTFELFLRKFEKKKQLGKLQISDQSGCDDFQENLSDQEIEKQISKAYTWAKKKTDAETSQTLWYFLQHNKAEISQEDERCKASNKFSGNYSLAPGRVMKP